MSGLLAALRTRRRDWSVVGKEGPVDGARLAKRVTAIAAALDDTPSGCVGLLADNGPGWIAADLALLASGRVCVPVPTFFSPAQVSHVTACAGIRTWLLDRPCPPFAIGADGDGHDLGDGLWLWRTTAPRRGASTPPPGTVKITFTSGTTGEPKGVCLSLETLESVAGSVGPLAEELGVRRHLCALPLSLLLENVAGVYAGLLACVEVVAPPLAQLGWSGSSSLDLGRFVAELASARPESLILVPELLHGLVGALELGAPRPESLRLIAVGGGRVSSGLLDRAHALGLPVFEGYGLSECGSVVTLNRPGHQRRDSVGRALPHARIELAPDGEVVVRGPRMLGYLGEPDSGDRGLWLTGDIGSIDDDGFLRLSGRKRNVFITSHGRNLSPEWVESELVQTLEIAQAVVFGEARPWNAAVIVARRSPADHDAVEAAVQRANERLPDYARVSGWVLAEAPFTSANGLCTANGRIRRDAVEHRYAAAIEQLYHPQEIPCRSTIS